MAGFLTLAFNPHAWAVVGITFILAFSGGVVKGWNASNADHWKQHAKALEEAARQKDRIIEADAARAAADQSELVRLDATIESLVHEAKMSACRLSPGELERLRLVASGRAGRRS